MLQEGAGTGSASSLSIEAQAEFGQLPRLPVHCKSQSFAQAAHELEVYLQLRAARTFGEHSVSSGAFGSTEQACIVFKDDKPFAAACWRYGRTLALGLVRDEELLSDADLACFVCQHGCVGTALQGECSDRLLLREYDLSSLAAALKTHDVLGSWRKKDSTALMDVQDVLPPLGSGHDLNGCAHDWDTLFRRLGWAGSCSPMRSAACQRKQRLQQQGTCSAVGRGHSVLNRACHFQEALDWGTADDFTGLTDDSWSIDSITFSSLHLMSVQSRTKQRRAAALKLNSPGVLL